MSPRPDSVHSTTSSSDSHDSEENYVPMNPNLSNEDQVCAGLAVISLSELPLETSSAYSVLTDCTRLPSHLSSYIWKKQ